MFKKPYNDKKIILLSISMFDSYRIIRYFYNSLNTSSKYELKKLLTEYIGLIKEKFIENLFRFQLSYLTNKESVKLQPYVFNYAFDNILVKDIGENKLNEELDYILSKKDSNLKLGSIILSMTLEDLQQFINYHHFEYIQSNYSQNNPTVVVML